MKEQLVTVNMTYARIALILLALNLLATGYTLTKLYPSDSPEKAEPVTTQSQDTACAGCGQMRHEKNSLRFL